MDINYKNGTESVNLSGDFSSLNLSELSPVKKSERKPKRILHFSDGILEEFSSDEETDPPNSNQLDDVTDIASLTWKPWMSYWATKTGKNLLSTCDYIGEGLANFLGITSQKYFYEIEEYKRRMKEEEEERKEVAAEMAGWTTDASIPSEEDKILDREDEFFEKKFEFRNETSTEKEATGGKGKF